MSGRRRFLRGATGAVAAVAAATLVDAPNVIAQPKIQWRMSTAFPQALDQLNGAARHLAKIVDLQRTLDHAAAAVEVYGLTDYHVKNALALERLKTEFKGKVEILPLALAVLRDLKKISAEVVTEQSEKTPLAKKVHASFTKFQALVGPWDHVAEGAYHRLVAG